MVGLTQAAEHEHNGSAVIHATQRQFSGSKGSLLSKVYAAAITRATQKMQAVSETDTQVRERMKYGAYHCYSLRLSLCDCSSKVLFEEVLD